MDTLTLPKRHREGSFTPADIQDALDTFAALPEGSREAVVVGRDFDTENGARNRARLMANALQEHDGTLYSAHAVKGDDDKWIGAVSVRTNQDPRQPSTDRPEGAPSLRALQDAARGLKIKGRSKMDYDALWAALLEAAPDVDPNTYGKG
jgi:hypothetical protein